MTEKKKLELIPEENLAKVSGGLKVKSALKGVGIILLVGGVLYLLDNGGNPPSAGGGAAAQTTPPTTPPTGGANAVEPTNEPLLDH